MVRTEREKDDALCEIKDGFSISRRSRLGKDIQIWADFHGQDPEEYIRLSMLKGDLHRSKKHIRDLAKKEKWSTIKFVSRVMEDAIQSDVKKHGSQGETPE